MKSVKHNNFDILLINPAPFPGWDYRNKQLYAPPAGVLSIGTVLKMNGFTVKVIDGAYEEDYLKSAEDIVKGNDLLFVGISAMTAQVPLALSVAAKVREVKPKALLVWGGIHPSLFPEQTVMHNLVDTVVVGEGEYSLLELARFIKQGKDYRLTPGTVSKNNGQLIINKSRNFLDLERLPFFDFSLLDIKKYILKDRTEIGGQNIETGPIRRCLPILSGLGCPFHCAFCIESIMKKEYRRRSAESLITEIERLIAQYDVNDISFIDDTFFADRNRLLRFLDLLEEKKIDISWTTGGFRANYFHTGYLNLELLKRIRRLGGYHFGLGVESGSKRILQKIDKQITKEQVVNAVKWCKEASINLNLNFMIGFPGETEEDMSETIRFAFYLVNQNPKDSCIFGPSVFRPYPGSKLFEECVDNYDFKLPQSLEEWKEVFSHEEGYFKMENLPWIKNPQAIRIYSFYLNRATSNFYYTKLWMRILNGFLKRICRLRIRLNFFCFPFEYGMMLLLKRAALDKTNKLISKIA